MSNISVFQSDDKTQSVSIFIPDHHKKVVVDVSGGTDSSLCLYFVCLYIREHNRTDVEVTIRHCIDRYRVPYSYDNCAKFIFDKFEKEFSDIKFNRHLFSFIELQPTVTKTIVSENDKLDLVKTQGYQCFFSSKTANPSKEIQEKNGMWGSGLKHRELDNANKLKLYKAFDNDLIETDNIETCRYINNKPLMRVNKSFVADWYFKIPFLKDIIFPLTASCVCSDPIITKVWTQPCKTCWWCKEKKWAFGKYDYEELK